MSISENIKRLRNDQHLTQQEFADRIGVKRNTVATYEMGRSTPSEAAIVLICREFGVRREWLETGLGEMYTRRNSGLVKQLSAELNLDAKSVEFLENFLQLTAANRQLVIAGLEQAAKLFPRKPDDELTPDERAEIVRQERIDELAAEKRATQTSSASTGTNGTSKKIGNGS